MTTVVEVHTHECISWLEDGEENSSICLCSGVWLNICVFGTEELTNAVDGKLLYFVDNLASAVISFTRISLSIFVCKTRAHGSHHFFTYEVLACNKFHAFMLALVFLFD